MPEFVLGLSAYYHDSAAALVRDGRVVAAAQEERFSRRRHDSSFPLHAVEYCLDEAGIGLADLAGLAYYEDPRLKFRRVAATYAGIAPGGFDSFRRSLPAWLTAKLHIGRTVRRELGALSSDPLPPVRYFPHHESHAASAFFPSPYESAAVLCIDGVGEWATTTLWHGAGDRIQPVSELRFPHSLGLLYSAFTYFCGFKVDSGEYKLMGLAPYGEPRFADTIREHLLDVKPDGSFRLNMDHFEYLHGKVMTGKGFERLFGGPKRSSEGPLTEREFDLAASVQVVTEEIVLRLARTARAVTGESRLCLAGGVALNCVANGRIVREQLFEEVWVQPAAGDAGGALGAALLAGSKDRSHVAKERDAMAGSLLGPQYDNDVIRSYLDSCGARYEELSSTDLTRRVAVELGEGKIVGWFQGRMEFGPRALGARSILGDPRNPQMQSTMNQKIKFRESFRPFAPVVLADHTENYFELKQPSPYMLVVADVASEQRLDVADDTETTGLDRLQVHRTTIPAVTHVDMSARVQTVDDERNPLFHQLLTDFHRHTDCPVLVNTSFNVRGEPIVRTPRDAYTCFMRTNIDVLALGDFLLHKADQPEWSEDSDWRDEIPLD